MKHTSNGSKGGDSRRPVELPSFILTSLPKSQPVALIKKTRQRDRRWADRKDVPCLYEEKAHVGYEGKFPLGSILLVSVHFGTEMLPSAFSASLCLLYFISLPSVSKVCSSFGIEVFVFVCRHPLALSLPHPLSVSRSFAFFPFVFTMLHVMRSLFA